MSNISINARDREVLLDLADQAADKLTRSTGMHVTRHGALNLALRTGLAEILGVSIPLDNEPRRKRETGAA